MASYDVTVDTRDMANKIDSVSEHVSNVKNAVVAMEAAVILAEQQASNRVCTKLNRGFFALITAQIEQKNATALSELEALASELTQQSETLMDFKQRMGDDFLILTERYSKLFNTLNVALHNRIYELEKPLMNLCEKEVRSTLSRLNRLIASVPVNQAESIAASQTIAAAHIKRNAQTLIKKMTSFLTSCRQQNLNIEKIKLNTGVSRTEKYALPALVIVQSNEQGGSMISTRLPSCINQLMGPSQEDRIRDLLYQQAASANWQAPEREGLRNIAGEFEQLMQNSNLPKRVKDTMSKLYAENAKWLAIKEG